MRRPAALGAARAAALGAALAAAWAGATEPGAAATPGAPRLRAAASAPPSTSPSGAASVALLPRWPWQRPPPGEPRRSAYQDMGAAVRAMQDDEAQNPGFLWREAGAEAWQAPAGPAGRRCADCHGADALTAMRGVATRYPAYDARLGRPLTLGQRIRQCRVERQGAADLATESEALLGLETLVASASRGLPIAPDADPRLAPWLARGEARWRQRLGQLDLSCAQCHDERAGARLAGTPIPQAHPTGYPQYRLEWQALGSLQRRLRNCLTGVRAEPFPDGDPAWTELGLYLMRRAAGLPLETPAVRP
ncbi:sulfur oxidation c-type cytochrome SoxA [Piscinibacter sakaiensis]|uniref:L-cysteine S-thiosulfotransferase subunit SoxA n=1 Tax=Piscinibacter sakaiensis TaxID=1547922 RepID=A0A0K8P4P8_PISS1|nr:sulfur oxidation c-type cytochrome SoxA [Piscinibacter sakaiensis]GAP37135.1 sulfur oxidation protein SoxA [Piscinibacter sakaiensis]